MNDKSDTEGLPTARLYVVMGVAGCGKTTIGEALAAAIGGTFLDGGNYPATPT
ncbi:MAG: hypothetical protein GKR97_20980 [Rhizobiaceae bacterium]|nr:hypothetical protein [Rhizobiaceae bacterium]